MQWGKLVCFYCKKLGHMIADCNERLHTLQYKTNLKPNVDLAFSQTDSFGLSSVLSEPVCKDPQLCFKPFTFGGFISRKAR